MIIPVQDRRAVKLLLGLAFATCFNGFDAGIMTVILADTQFNDYYDITPAKCGLVATIPWAGIALAQLFVGGTLANLVGRLTALRISICCTIIGVTIQVLPNKYWLLILGRLLTGLGFGCVHIATTLYVSECAPARFRGALVGTVSQFGYQLGTLFAFWTGYGMSFVKTPYNIAWRVSNVMQIPIGLVVIASSFIYAESPRWLLEKFPETPQKSLTTLAWIRAGKPDDEHVQTEFHEITASLLYRKRFEPGYLGLLHSRALRKRLLYGFYVMALQQIGGIAVLTIYAALIYKSLGWNVGSQALVINGVQSTLQLAFVLVNTFTVDRFGRKAPLIVGFTIQSIALLVLAILLSIWRPNENKVAAVVEIAMIFVVGLTYCCTNGPVSLAIAAEIFPQHVRDKGLGISLLGQTSCLVVLTQLWPTFNQAVGGRSYWLLFSLNVVALISVIFIIRETKGVSLERMDKLFGEVDTVEEGERITVAGEALRTMVETTSGASFEKTIATGLARDVTASDSVDV